MAVWGGAQAGRAQVWNANMEASLPAEEKQCITELKMANRKSTLNSKQVSIAIPMSISVGAFSRTVICE